VAVGGQHRSATSADVGSRLSLPLRVEYLQWYGEWSGIVLCGIAFCDNTRKRWKLGSVLDPSLEIGRCSDHYSLLPINSKTSFFLLVSHRLFSYQLVFSSENDKIPIDFDIFLNTYVL